MMQVRPPAVAGMFYPEERETLRETVRSLLHDAGPVTQATHPKAVIVPHAGYIYSGPTAARAYKAVEGADIGHVVLLGPAHRVPVIGMALPEVEAFETPLGEIPVDTKLCKAAASLPQVIGNRAAHTLEHSLEVQLPFLQTVLGPFSLVPLVVGQARAERVAELLDLLWGDRRTLFVISSDLSHYHTYEEARRLDGQTCERIVGLNPDILHDRACGATPVNGLLTLARNRKLQPHLIDYRNSGDTAGDKGQVVGYGAFAFYEPDA